MSECRPSLSGVQEQYVHRFPGSLAGLVTTGVGYRISGLRPGTHVGMPSGTVTLIVPLDELLTVSGPRDGTTGQYAGLVAGLHTGPALVHHAGRQHGIQLALRPSGVRHLLGCPSAELAERSVQLEDVLGPAARLLREQLHEQGSWALRFTTIERVLLDALSRRTREDEPAAEVVHAWRLIRHTAGRSPIREVARQVGWSTRYLEQRFRAEYGVTPKSAARISRFERSLVAVRQRRQSLADLAVACGFADQAHLAREWRDLAGVAPSRWRVEDELAFVQDDEHAGVAASTA